MFGRIRDRRRLKVEAPATGSTDVLSEEFKDEDVPTVEAPHVVWLRNSKGGPYYLAPDSTEALPSEIWANLEPDAVQAEAERINRLLGGEEWRMGRVEPQLRDSLLTEGALGRRVLQVLEGRTADTPDSTEGPASDENSGADETVFQP